MTAWSLSVGKTHRIGAYSAVRHSYICIQQYMSMQYLINPQSK